MNDLIHLMNAHKILDFIHFLFYVYILWNISNKINNSRKNICMFRFSYRSIRHFFLFQQVLSFLSLIDLNNYTAQSIMIFFINCFLMVSLHNQISYSRRVSLEFMKTTYIFCLKRVLYASLMMMMIIREVAIR